MIPHARGVSAVRLWHGGNVKVMSAAINIAITDTSGSRRHFQANRASLDCGAGTFEFRAGCPTYCRKFDNAVLRITDTSGDTAFVLHRGTASLTAAALHILCEEFREDVAGEPPRA